MRVDGEEVHLTPIEFDLLRTLVRNRGRLMTHRALLTEVWGPEYADDTATLRTHIANLRRKIEPAAAPRYIRTDPGVGYRFAADAPLRVCNGGLDETLTRRPIPCGLDGGTRMTRHRHRTLVAILAARRGVRGAPAPRSSCSTAYERPTSFGLIVSVLVFAYLLVALLRGERF